MDGSTSLTIALDAEYRRLWLLLDRLSEDDESYEPAFVRVCEIEEERDYSKDELRALRARM